MYSDSTIDIKKLIDSNSYLIVYDTNIFLNLYRISPDYADFALDCMNNLVDYTIIPHTVFIEFKKHNKKLYEKRQKSIEHSIEDSLKMIIQQKQAIINSCNVLKKRNFPDINEVINQIESKYSSVEKLLHDYFEEHSVLSLINDSWDCDLPEKLMQRLTDKAKVLNSPSMAELYSICEEGEDRFKSKIPPGYKDEKHKSGIRQYCDLIWWKEILNFAKENTKNIILVTDDVKEDWWIKENEKLKFRDELINEFKKFTRYKIKTESGNVWNELEIVPFISNEFFEGYAKSYKVEKPDAIDIAVSLTDADYITTIQDKVFEKVVDELAYSNEDFIDLSSMSHFGSEGVEEWEVIDYDLVEFGFDGRDGETVYYNLKYLVTLSGDSYDYWGRDPDTKDIMLSDSFYHEVKGIVEVSVSRKVNMFLDFLEDSEFEDCKIIECELKESNYIDRAEEAYLCDAYDTCPRCGSPITNDNDAGNGFCLKCSGEDDDI